MSWSIVSSAAVILVISAVLQGTLGQCNPQPTCEFASDCALKLCPTPGPARDDEGCPYRDCRCFITPPVNRPGPSPNCPVCFTQPCPCTETCPTLQCPKDCGTNGWIIDSRGCNTCDCKSDCEFFDKCSSNRCRLRLDSAGCPLENCLCDNGCLEVQCPVQCTSGFVFRNGCKTCECKPPIAPPSKVCEFADDCRVVRCGSGIKLDNNGCPFQNCPCNDSPVVTISPPTCPFNIDCAAKTCFGGVQTDSNGCALRGCPCAGNNCDESFRCDLTCSLAFENGCPTCRCECGPPCITDQVCTNGRVVDLNGCETCECLPDPRVTPPAPTEKPGRCPAAQNYGWRTCRNDFDCRGVQKCCPSSSSHHSRRRNRCTDPERKCPSSLGTVISGPNCPENQCTNDEQCGRNRLCCGGCPRRCVQGELPPLLPGFTTTRWN